MRAHSRNMVYAAILLVASILLSVLLYAIYEALHIPAAYRIATDVIMVIVFGTLIIEFLARSVRLYAKEEISTGEARTLGNIMRLLGYSILAIIILSMLGINVTGLLIGAGFLGIVVGLAAQPTLSNMFSGIAIMMSKPFEVGDKITMLTWQYGVQAPSYPHEAFVPGFTGTVKSIGIIYTTIIEEDGTPADVPNSILNQAMIINHRSSGKKMVRIRLNVDKRIPFEQLRSMLLQRIAAIKAVNISDASVDISLVAENGYHIILKFWTVPRKEDEARSRALSEAISVLKSLEKRAKRQK